MTETIQKTRKKYLLMLEERLVEVFKDHIGADKAISSPNLYWTVYHVLPDTINFYESVYKYNLMKKVLHKLRREMRLFVIIKRNQFFVLKTKDELDKFSKFIDISIIGLNQLRSKAETWVAKQSWSKLEK